MARVFAHHLRRDMAVLGLCELLLSAVFLGFLLVSVQKWAGSAGISWPAMGSAMGLAGTIAVSIAVTAATMGLYRPQICRDPGRMLVTTTITGIIASPFILWVSGSSLSGLTMAQMGWLAQVLGVWFAAVLVSRVSFGLLSTHGRFTRRILIVADGASGAHLRALIARHHDPLFAPILVTSVALPAMAGDLRRKPLWGVVVVGGALSAPAVEAILAGRKNAVKIFSDAGFQERHLGRIDPAVAAAADPAVFQPDGERRLSDRAKRVLDVAVGIALLIGTLPIMVAIALAIKLDSPGPVFYRQLRTGLNGRSFTLLKFRSMRADAESGGTPRWAQKQDPRITRIGHFIRQTRIDELPQLLNVLRGDMSVVGPRPERPHFVKELALAIEAYNIRDRVKPGITGWAQVNYPYGASVADAREKLAYDLYYVKNRGFLMDLLILCSTVRVILFREGAR
jgi:exopolysaccharide biosynthesis polyprenyl glycosylphosphotransferase